jgi:hypothetical protein
MSNQQESPKQVKQQLLDQINAQRDAIEALSDEELEVVAGGMKFVNVNTGALNMSTVEMRPMNTGAMLPTHIIKLGPAEK